MSARLSPGKAKEKKAFITGFQREEVERTGGWRTCSWFVETRWGGFGRTGGQHQEERRGGEVC